MYKYNILQNDLVQWIKKIDSVSHAHFLVVIAENFHKGHLKCLVFRLTFYVKSK